MKRLISLIVLCAALAAGQSFSDRVEAIMNRPEYGHSRFGIEVLSLQTGKSLYVLNAQQLFVPGSTTKLITEGIALALLGPDYRFHTRVYRTGAIDANGVLIGDLVILASGDPNLSNRIQADGTLAFQNVDHSYSALPGAKVVSGDPLTVLRALARQVAAAGIRKVSGQIRVDASLFPEGQRELGTDVVMSPIVVNDNLIDVTFVPGAEGEPASVEVSPKQTRLTVVNNVRTATKGSQIQIEVSVVEAGPSGTSRVSMTGSIPPGARVLRTVAVPTPSEFAAAAFAETLHQAGVEIEVDRSSQSDVIAKYEPELQVAEHVSAPFSEEVKVTLKVSQNLHAGITPFLIGALVAGKHGDAAYQAGFDRMREYLEKAGLDASGASQSDGAGGDAFFTPDFMVRYLEHLSRQSIFPAFYSALPVLGKDGTLWDIQSQSPAAGHVHAKTGTYATYNALGKNLMVTGKGLAGYVERKDGGRLAIAVYANQIAGDPASIAHHVGEALGEIAAAAWDAPFAPLEPTTERRLSGRNRESTASAREKFEVEP